MTPIDPSPPVTLDVGGQSYITGRDTLQRGGPVLAQVDSAVPCIDRDGRRFKHVLNYLRAGALVEGLDRPARAALRREAAYFKVPGLVGALDVQEKWNRLHDAVSLNGEKVDGPAIDLARALYKTDQVEQADVLVSWLDPDPEMDVPEALYNQLRGVRSGLFGECADLLVAALSQSVEQVHTMLCSRALANPHDQFLTLLALQAVSNQPQRFAELWKGLQACEPLHTALFDYLNDGLAHSMSSARRNSVIYPDTFSYNARVRRIIGSGGFIAQDRDNFEHGLNYIASLLPAELPDMEQQARLRWGAIHPEDHRNWLRLTRHHLATLTDEAESMPVGRMQEVHDAAVSALLRASDSCGLRDCVLLAREIRGLEQRLEARGLKAHTWTLQTLRQLDSCYPSPRLPQGTVAPEELDGLREQLLNVPTILLPPLAKSARPHTPSLV